MNLWAYSKSGLREIPTNRWFWVEVSPGHFVPKPALADIRGSAAANGVEWQAELAQADIWQAYLRANRPDVAQEAVPALWCLWWATTANAPRVACIDGGEIG